MISPLPRRFPGEGRGPVAERQFAGAAFRYLHLSNWAPASAGEGERLRLHIATH